MFACNQKEKEQQLKEYITLFKETNKVLNQHNSEIYKEIKWGMDEFWGNPLRTKPWYDASLKLKNKTKEIVKKIDGLIGQIDPIEVSIKKEKLDSLATCIKQYENEILRLRGIRGEDNEMFIEGLKKSLSTNNWPQQLYKSNNFLEKQAILNKIRTEVLLAETITLSVLFSKVDIGCFRFWKIEPKVIPISEMIPLGERYIADIVLGYVDSTRIYKYQVDGKTYISDEYKATYKEIVKADSGSIKREGRFVVPRKYLKDSLVYPFTIQYKVLKK